MLQNKNKKSRDKKTTT